MTEDARFEDGVAKPLNLGAEDEEDLKILSALAQDGVFTGQDLTWQAAQRRFALLINRVRREDVLPKGTVERARALLVIDNVLGVASQGVDRSDTDMVLQVLELTFEEGEEGAGYVLLTLAGDGALRLKVEALEVTLKDVTKPYLAPSGKTPDHDL